MKRLNLVYIVFSFIAVFALTACQTGGGYNYGSWGYSTKNQKPAQAAPDSLAKAASAGTAAQTQIEKKNLAPPENKAAAAETSNLPPVKVGLLLPLSGQHSSLGQAMLQAAQVALFDVGYGRFELLPQDTNGTPQGAQQAAELSLKEGAQIILGPVFANSVKAVKPIAQRGRINVIGFSTDWTLAGGNTFLMGFMPFDQIERIVEYAAAQNIQQIAVIAPQTNYGSAVTSAYRSMASYYNLPTTDIMTFPPETSNLAPTLRTFTQYDERILQAELERDGLRTMEEIQQNKSKKKEEINLLDYPPPFDAVLMPVGGDLALSISNLLSHYELPPSTVKRLGTGLLDDPGLANEDSLEGTWFAAPSPRLRKSFENRFSELYGGQPPRLASLAYDATALAAVLAQRGLKSRGQPAFDRASITNPNGFAGVDGIFRFRSNGTAERGLAILEFRRGKIKIVDDAPDTFEQHTPF